MSFKIEKDIPVSKFYSKFCETLDKLKAEKLKIERWRESREVTAQVKTIIYDNLLYLPQEKYTDEEVGSRATNVYQHIFSNYHGGGKSVYQEVA